MVTELSTLIEFLKHAWQFSYTIRIRVNECFYEENIDYYDVFIYLPFYSVLS